MTGRTIEGAHLDAVEVERLTGAGRAQDGVVPFIVGDGDGRLHRGGAVGLFGGPELAAQQAVCPDVQNGPRIGGRAADRRVLQAQQYPFLRRAEPQLHRDIRRSSDETAGYGDLAGAGELCGVAVLDAEDAGGGESGVGVGAGAVVCGCFADRLGCSLRLVQAPEGGRGVTGDGSAVVQAVTGYESGAGPVVLAGPASAKSRGVEGCFVDLAGEVLGRGDLAIPGVVTYPPPR